MNGSIIPKKVHLSKTGSRVEGFIQYRNQIKNLLRIGQGSKQQNPSKGMLKYNSFQFTKGANEKCC
jgi:hypothetical protein